MKRLLEFTILFASFAVFASVVTNAGPPVESCRFSAIDGKHCEFRTDRSEATFIVAHPNSPFTSCLLKIWTATQIFSLTPMKHFEQAVTFKLIGGMGDSQASTVAASNYMIVELGPHYLYQIEVMMKTNDGRTFSEVLRPFIKDDSQKLRFFVEPLPCSKLLPPQTI